MKRIPHSLVTFLEKQHIVFVSTVNGRGEPNTVPKGICLVQPKGRIYVIDLYYGRTWRNLKRNNHITLCALDERHFRGYQFKGTGKVLKITPDHNHFVDVWHKKVSSRITHRLIENLREDKKTHHHEAHFPPPKAIIEVEVKEIISLTEWK
ncbi:pyridoxamine 5'-phosphate oxidase family protein [Candidatus Omnitrophota bacterium]